MLLYEGFDPPKKKKKLCTWKANAVQCFNPGVSNSNEFGATAGALQLKFWPVFLQSHHLSLT